MANNTKKHTFTDSKITLNVVEPTNVTGNDAYISQRFWTNTNQPFSGNTGSMGGTSKYNWYGNFISCMELDWGNAKGSESDFIKSAMTENQIKTLLFDQGIKTSDELLQVLCWLFKNRGSSNISFEVTGTNSVNYNGTITLTAVVGEGGDENVTTWKWNTSNGSFANNSITGITSFTPSGNGASKTLKIVGNNQSYNSWSLPTPTATAVTLSSATGSSTSKCTPGTASRTGKALTVYVQAYNSTTTSSTVVKQCTFGAPANQSQEATAYKWSIVNGGDYITLSNDTSQTCTITGKNSTYSQQTAKIKCTVTYGANGTKDTSDSTITVPAKTTVTTKYVYAGQTDPRTSGFAWSSVTHNGTSVLKQAVTSKVQVNIGLSGSRDYWYIAVPNDLGYTLYDSTGTINAETAMDSSTTSIGGVTYKVYVTAVKSAALNQVVK